MPLTTHGRYPYSPIVERPRYDWPKGEGLAVFLAVNVEHFPFGEGMGVPLAPAQPEPDVVNFSWRDYGNRVGVWRLLAEFDRLALPAAWADTLIDQFDEMAEQARHAPLVFNLSLHPFLVGWPFRLRHLRRVLEHIAHNRDRVWLTRPGAIAAHIASLPDGTLP